MSHFSQRAHICLLIHQRNPITQTAHHYKSLRSFLLLNFPKGEMVEWKYSTYINSQEALGTGRP